MLIAILLVAGTALLTFAITRIAFGGDNEVTPPILTPSLFHQLRYLTLALPEILAVVGDLESGVATLDTEVSALIARVNAGAGGISAADADALQARLESLKATIAAIPAMPS